MEFTGKVVLISGATGGIGKEIALQLSEENCKLALFARRKEKLKEIANEALRRGSQCIYKRCDVKNKEDIKKAVEFTHKKYGRVNIAILAAGILIPNPVEDFDSSIIKDTMDVNFMANIYFLEYLLPIMKAQKEGIIAAISTLPDKRGVPGWGAYGASKAALSLFLESLRAEVLQKYGIRIITIKPGSVKTPMIEKYHRPGAMSPEDAAKIIIEGIKKEKKVIEFPFSQVLLIKLTNMFPIWAYDRIPIHLQKGEGYPSPKEK
jgi:short-subunit dehydrogenase